MNNEHLAVYENIYVEPNRHKRHNCEVEISTCRLVCFNIIILTRVTKTYLNDETKNRKQPRTIVGGEF